MCSLLFELLVFYNLVLKPLSGDYCEADFDGCQDNPCTEGTDCTDLTADEEVLTGRLYNCSDCPSGSKKDGGICFRKKNVRQTQHDVHLPFEHLPWMAILLNLVK